MKKYDKKRINELLRSNTVIFLLCVISISLLVMLVRRTSTAQVNTVAAENFLPVSNVPGAPIAISEPVSTAPANITYSPFKNMPSPSTFRSFKYEKGDVITVSSVCRDVYRVVLIYPKAVDYRSDPAAAKYNTATACIKGKTYKDSLILDQLHLDLGEKYYVISASQGKSGTWSDPK